MPKKKVTEEAAQELNPAPAPEAEQQSLMPEDETDTAIENVTGKKSGVDGKLPVELRLEQEIAALEESEKASLGSDSADTGTPDALVPKAPSNVTAAPVRQIVNFYQTDFKRLDRDLSDPEREEWNAIYASFRSKSILTGTVIGVDENELPVKNSETGRTEMQTIYSLVIIGYRVKILIPENAVWVNGEERPVFLMRGMIGATVDYVITHVDREGECCLASRASAMIKRRRAFLGNPRTAPKPGDILKCSALVVGRGRCLVTCGGYEVSQRTQDMSYTPILDMREVYRPGQEFSAKYLGYDAENENISLSVKLATPHPFIGADRRHPVGRRRQAVIQGKYGGGVFCTLPDGTIIMCLYSNNHLDTDFLLGDSVIVHIVQYDYKNMFIYGRIVSKW